MERSQKYEIVDALRQHLTEATFLIVTRQSGLNVDEQTSLRRAVRASGGVYRVTKNRLVKLALQGSPFEGLHLEEYLVGSTAMTFSTDPVAASKAVVDFAKGNDKIEIIGSALLPGQILSAQQVMAMAKLPSRDELRAALVGLVQAPAGKLVRLLTEPGGQLARIVSAQAEKLG